MKDSIQSKSLSDNLILNFEVMSPIHIGTREGKLTSLEFIVLKDKTYVIDEDKLGRFFQENGLIDAFVQEVGNGTFNMDKFLTAQKIPVEKCIRNISKSPIPGGSQSMNEFRPFVRDGNGDIFLPGSSLKGVFRTALLYAIADEKYVANFVENKLKNTNYLSERDKKKFSADLQKNLLQGFNLPNAKNAQNKDILRCLKVRDAYPIGEIQTRIIPINYLSKSKDKGFDWSRNKKINIWIESVIKGTFQVHLVWDKDLFEKFKKENPDKMRLNGFDDLKNMLSGMIRRTFEHEKEFYIGKGKEIATATSVGAWYEKNHGKSSDFIRVGYGSGFLNTTVGFHLDEPLRREILDRCGRPDNKRPGHPAPKTRRIWRNEQGQWMPLGWLCMSVADAVIKKDSDISTEVRKVVAQDSPSPFEKLLKELSLTKSIDAGKHSQIIQKIELLPNDVEKGNLAKAIQEKMSPKQFKGHPKKQYLLDLIAKAGL